MSATLGNAIVTKYRNLDGVTIADLVELAEEPIDTWYWSTTVASRIMSLERPEPIHDPSNPDIQGWVSIVFPDRGDPHDRDDEGYATLCYKLVWWQMVDLPGEILREEVTLVRNAEPGEGVLHIERGWEDEEEIA